MPSPKLVPLVLSDAERASLEALSRKRTVSQALDLSFRRIQFTPDLMPTDILGTEILEEDHTTGRRFFKFNKGPLFANIVLADEINRTPPKTQSALLEAMQEFEITYGGQTYPLDRPFFILATQNPIEQAGTYPLPEAQLDRFLLYIKIGYPNAEEEMAILSHTTGTKRPLGERGVAGFGCGAVWLPRGLGMGLTAGSSHSMESTSTRPCMLNKFTAISITSPTHTYVMGWM